MISLTYVKIAVGVGTLALASYGTWYTTRDHYQKEIARIQLGMAEAVQVELVASQAATKKAGEQHAKDQLDINRLRRDVDGVQVHIPTCSGALPEAGSDSDREARLLSERIDSAFARLQERLGRDAARCDQLNIDAIQSNEAQ